MRVKRAGISDVITSLILILTTISLASVFFFWGLGYMGQAQSATGAGINQATQKTQEQFSIDTVRFWCSGLGSSPCSGLSSANTLETSGDMVTVFVRNYGDVPVTIDHVYFNGKLYQACPGGPQAGIICFAQQFNPNCVPSSLPVASITTGSALSISARAETCVNLQLTAASLPNWNVGDTDSVLLASTRGNQFTASFTVPVQDFG